MYLRNRRRAISIEIVAYSIRRRRFTTAYVVSLYRRLPLI